MLPPLTGFFLLCLISVCVGVVDYKQCIYDWANLNNNLTAPNDWTNLRDLTGLTDGRGIQATEVEDIVGITYEVCVSFCAGSQVPFYWSDSYQQLSSWLLPWLALVSQLPFSDESNLNNLISLLLTVGSPTLAIYSLVITALNFRWVFKKFGILKYPNHRNAAQVLASLQQIPLKVTSKHALLASLVVLPENDRWWDDLVTRLEYNYTWSISNAVSVVWVVISFMFAVVNTFLGSHQVGPTQFDTAGLSIGSLWLWLLPLVVGWLWLPAAGRSNLVTALEKANNIAYVAAPDDYEYSVVLQDGTTAPIYSRSVSGARAISVLERREAVYQDEARSAPIFNYARVWGWMDAVEEVLNAFECASNNAEKMKTVSHEHWFLADPSRRADFHPLNRIGSLKQVQAYCGDHRIHERSLRKGAIKRIALASLIAVGLQWGTTISSILTMVFTPIKGLGCRSGSYILYGTLSTLIWMMLLASSFLNHYCSTRSSHDNAPRPVPSIFCSFSMAELISIFLRRIAVFLASVNSSWLFVLSIFQFTHVFNNCYCNSNILSGARGPLYDYVLMPRSDFPPMWRACLANSVVAWSVVTLFLLFLYRTVWNPATKIRK